jgi:hypothetical protein
MEGGHGKHEGDARIQGQCKNAMVALTPWSAGYDTNLYGCLGSVFPNLGKT